MLANKTVTVERLLEENEVIRLTNGISTNLDRNQASDGAKFSHLPSMRKRGLAISIFERDKAKIDYEEEKSRRRTSHLCQKPLDQAGCKSMDVHEWQGPEEESQPVNPQDRPPQYFSENLPHTGIEPALPEDFSPRHLRPYQLAYAPRGNTYQ
ncbi:Uncharacterized protein Fot_08406 [Forsythia ovata]|uniref:Uncharacterized protein n=1 Tax=Forsythia ovata TaxID=205694 RepID=A0ABD1WYI6_9LAMI